MLLLHGAWCRGFNLWMDFPDPPFIVFEKEAKCLITYVESGGKKAFESGILEDSIRLEAKDEVYS